MAEPKNRMLDQADPAIVADIVDRIVRVAAPDKIILFGSAARGTMGPDSDYDFLVIKGGKYKQSKVIQEIYRSMNGKAAVDIILATPEVIERYKDSFCLVYYPALREGKVVYEAEAVSG